MSFETKKNELLEIYNEMLDKVSNVIEKTFDNQLIFEENYWKAKLKCCTCKNNTHFSSQNVREEKVYCVCIVVILLISVL